MPDTQTAIEITQLGRVFITVTDQDKAIEFYVGTLGFEKRADIPFGENDRWVEVAPRGGEAALALVPPRDGTAVGGMTNVSLSTPDIDATHAGLVDHGVEAEAVMRWGDPVPPMFSFKDPDGNIYMMVEQP
jgi:catechol 2,3-dioxygenase-like lactoylglutathione lyase family enzyme